VGAFRASTGASGTITTASTESALAPATAGWSVAATAAPETATSATLGGLDEALVDLKDLLLLALALTLGLPTGSGDKILLVILVDRLGVRPLLILLAALVGLASLGDAGTKLELLLRELGKVISVGNAVVLGFRFSSRFNDAFTWCSVSGQSFLLFRLGNGLTGLLILQLSNTFVCAPAMAGLLLGVTVPRQERISS
jgi:hypothetical protein